jgi:mannose-6-phosphate isomerase-like protein (cupin superfamily)
MDIAADEFAAAEAQALRVTDAHEGATAMRAGEQIENPVTGERLVFTETAGDTDGAYTRFEAYIRPGGHLPTTHVHPYQTETFEIVSGELTMKLGGRTIDATSGDTIVVEPGTRHYFRNDGDEVAHFRVEVRPALTIEALMETMYGLAADGKTNGSGMPNPLQLAVVAAEHFDVVRLPIVPAWMQRTALAVGSRLGRLAGFQPFYEPTAVVATTATELELALSA